MLPTEITLHQQTRMLEIAFDDGNRYQLSHELLRVYSPSAEVTDTDGSNNLQVGKKEVEIRQINPMGTYAIHIEFDDAHNSGIYTWEYLHHLGENQERLWQDYLQRLSDAGWKHQ